MVAIISRLQTFWAHRRMDDQPENIMPPAQANGVEPQNVKVGKPTIFSLCSQLQGVVQKQH